MSKPKVILGDCSGKGATKLRAAGWGRMKIDRQLVNRRGELTVERGEPWAIDNGAFRMWTAGEPYNWERFERQLRDLEAHMRRDPVMSPLFAVTPDLPAEGLDSLLYSVEWMHAWHEREELAPIVRAAIPFYLAVQDGMTPADLEAECPVCDEPIVEHFAGVFLGGSSEWKVETASMWAERCHDSWRLPFHYARAGTIEKLEQAHDLRASSVDSAFPMWTAERWNRFELAWRNLPDEPQRELPIRSTSQYRLAV